MTERSLYALRHRLFTAIAIAVALTAGAGAARAQAPEAGRVPCRGYKIF